MATTAPTAIDPDARANPGFKRLRVHRRECSDGERDGQRLDETSFELRALDSQKPLDANLVSRSGASLRGVRL
jgi:hypothetical protein